MGEPGQSSLTLVDGRAWSPPFGSVGYGCYTTFVVDEDARVLAYGAHLDRLHRDSAALFDGPVDRALVAARVREHVRRVGLPCRFRVALVGDVDVARPERIAAVHVVTSSRPWRPVERPDAIRVRSHDAVRTVPEVKGLDLFQQVRLRRLARVAGYDDAVFRQGDALLEGATSSLVGWTADTVVTPAAGVLPGTTAPLLVAVSRDLGYAAAARAVTVADLPSLTLLASCTAVSPLVPVRAVDDRPVAVDRALAARVLAGLRAVERDSVGD